MKILADISHPAHAWFFKNALKLWQANGHEIKVVARDKEMNLRLLDCFGFEYEVLSKMRKGLGGLFLEMLEHERRLFKIARNFRPDAMVQIGGTFIAHVGKLLNIPSLVFYDTDNATLQNAITYPFSTVVCTPDCYPHDIGKKHVRYPGYHELAYLHPNVYTPNPAILDELGIKKDEKFFLLRFVSWEASHDVGESGFSPDNKLKFAQELEKYGKVFITSEAPLPGEFEKYRIKVGVEKIHDLMAYCSLYIGESATMASECSVLGIPAIYISKTPRCYTTEQETRYSMVFNYTNTQQEQAFVKMKELLAKHNLKELWKQKQQQLLADKIDVTKWMVEYVEEFVRKQKQGS